MDKIVVERDYEGTGEISLAKDRVIVTPRMRGRAISLGVEEFLYEFEHSSGRELRVEEILRGGRVSVRKIPRHLFKVIKLKGGNLGLYGVENGEAVRVVSIAEFPIYYEDYTGSRLNIFDTAGVGRSARSPWLGEDVVVHINVGSEAVLDDRLSRLHILSGVTVMDVNKEIHTGFIEMVRNSDGDVEYRYNGEPVIIKKWEDRYKTMRGFSKALYSAMLGNGYMRTGRLKLLRVYGHDMGMTFRFEVRFGTREV